MPTYDPSKVSVTIDNQTVILKGESTFVKAAYDEDQYGKKIGADGKGTRFRNPNKGGTIEVTLLFSSPTNDDLMEIAQRPDGGDVVTVQVKDQTGTAVSHAAEAWVKKIPDMERAKELGEVTWIYDTIELDITQGSTTED